MIIQDHICTNWNLKFYTHLAEADPETLLHLRCSSLILKKVNYCHKEVHLKSSYIWGFLGHFSAWAQAISIKKLEKSNLEKFLIFFQKKKNVLIFPKMELFSTKIKNFLMFLEKKILHFEKRNFPSLKD